MGPTVFRDADTPWQTRPDGTKVHLFHLGDDLSVQVVRKDAATVGQTFVHTHPETQVTIIEKGTSRMEIRDETQDLGPGDMVIIPGGVQHKFTDMSQEIQVIDLLVPPRRQGDLPPATP